jgi:hypothetical protein
MASGTRWIAMLALAACQTPGGPTASDGDASATLTREADPVVLTGAEVPGLGTVAATDIVGFARRDGAWVQVPIQVDERVVIDLCEVYGKSSGRWTASPACKTDQVLTSPVYADPETYTGADPDPLFDLDDEVVWMARDAGDRVVTWADPPSVVIGSGVEVELMDGEERAWLYLFERAEDSVDPGAGAQYVSYEFTLLDGVDYLTEYDLYGENCGNATCDPTMLEDSVVVGRTYRNHFSARWVSDALEITADGATGVDILDLHQARFTPASCGRHVLTFATAEGAFAANRSGPVRGIRSYLGANSGPLTQRDHLFYDTRQDIVTMLRVHAVSSGIMDVMDYSPEAIGMTYYNGLHPNGLTIDGVPDVVDESTTIDWELVTGPQGSLVMHTEYALSFDDSNARFYWEDDLNTTNDQCDDTTVLSAPDASAIGVSGLWFEGALPNTDPVRGESDTFVHTRRMLFREPNMAVDTAIAIATEAADPVQVLARAVGSEGLGADCGDGVCDADEPSSCAVDCVPVDQTCGDTVCQVPENSGTCPVDCPGGETGSVCGNGVCDAVENELSCPRDCWSGFAAAVECVEAACPSVVAACDDEPDCVAMVVCIGECVAQGTGLNQCQTDCAASVPISEDNAQVASGVLACAQSGNCL